MANNLLRLGAFKGLVLALVIGTLSTLLLAGLPALTIGVDASALPKMSPFASTAMPSKASLFGNLEILINDNVTPTIASVQDFEVSSRVTDMFVKEFKDYKAISCDRTGPSTDFATLIGAQKLFTASSALVAKLNLASAYNLVGMHDFQNTYNFLNAAGEVDQITFGLESTSACGAFAIPSKHDLLEALTTITWQCNDASHTKFYGGTTVFECFTLTSKIASSVAKE